MVNDWTEKIHKVVDDWAEGLIVLGDIVSNHNLEQLKERLVKALQKKEVNYAAQAEKTAFGA